MITPLYPIASTPATITVVAPGALAAATSLPVDALTIALPIGYVIEFGSGKFAKLAAAAAVDDEELDTAPLPLDIATGLTATIPGSSASMLLGAAGDKWANLSSDALRLAYHLDAELALDLRAPAYTGADADELAYAIVHQILFMLQHGITPSVIKSTANSNLGTSITYRDRWIDPTAAAIVARVTGRQQIRFTPPFAGV